MEFVAIIDIIKDKGIWSLPVLWLTLSAVINLLTRFRSVEKWVELAEKKPRTANVIRLVRALGIDPVKALKVLTALVRGQAISSNPPKDSLPPPKSKEEPKTTEPPKEAA